MDINNIHATWSPNGRNLPTATDRQTMLEALEAVAHHLASEHDNSDDLCVAVEKEIQEYPENWLDCGWDADRVKFVLAHCYLSIT
jgi:hypothetical protein